MPIFTNPSLLTTYKKMPSLATAENDTNCEPETAVPTIGDDADGEAEYGEYDGRV